MRCSVVAFVAPLAFLLPAVTSAQIRASELGTVSQTVDGTLITVVYSRPQVRGRDSLFGKVIAPAHMWTPGANWATTLELSRDVKLNARDVPAGKYSMWMHTGPGEWTVYLHKNPRLFHTREPKAEEMTLALPVTPAKGEHTEVLTFDFPRVAGDGATLRMRWGTAVVPLEITVAPTRATVLSDAQLAPYVGSYLLTFEGPTGPGKETKFELINARGALRGIVDGPTPWTIEFFPTGEANRFLLATVEKGKIVDVETCCPVQFTVQDGRAVSLRTPTERGGTWFQAQRRK